jgi:hypothetical protein
MRSGGSSSNWSGSNFHLAAMACATPPLGPAALPLLAEATQPQPPHALGAAMGPNGGVAAGAILPQLF